MLKFLISGLILLASIGSTVYCREDFFHDLTWLVQGGIKHGSIVGRNKVDGMSGATKTLWNASAAAEFKIKGHRLQTGLIIGKTDQRVNYSVSPESPFEGVSDGRNISLLLLDIPVLYNFHFFSDSPKGNANGKLIAGIGGFASFVLSKRIDTHVNRHDLTPSEKMSDWVIGPFFRLTYLPLDFGRIQPGLFFDFYRSLAPKYFYDDPYFKQNGIAGQLGTINFGISFRLKEI
jgi:hypothetical protein